MASVLYEDATDQWQAIVKSETIVQFLIISQSFCDLSYAGYGD